MKSWLAIALIILIQSKMLEIILGGRSNMFDFSRIYLQEILCFASKINIYPIVYL